MAFFQRRLHDYKSISLYTLVYLYLSLSPLKIFQNLNVSSADAVQTVELSGESDICKTL
jgi:hypothetical protein